MFRNVKGEKSGQRFYKDVKMIGKHYLVRSKKHPKIKRQYTITNCMRSVVHAEYMRVINAFKQQPES